MRSLLKPLPQSIYEYAQWRYVKPGIDYHLQVDKRYYSVPHQLVGIRLDARITDKVIEIFLKGKRVTTHVRSHKERFSTHNDHMPPAHQAQANWSMKRFINWANKDFGRSTVQVVGHLFSTVDESKSS